MHIDDWSGAPEGLRMYVDASISLRYNLAGRYDTMPFNMRNAIAQDTLFAYEHREATKEAIMRNAETFRAALDAVWHVPGEYDVTEPGLAVIPDTWYLTYTLQSTAEQHSYFVHYDYVYGTLLIDGQEMGTLPQSYRMNDTYRHVLGDKNPIVYPSPLRGMDFALSEPIRGHRIHLGYRNKRLIIRADQGGELLEFIPSHVFGVEGPTPDLPRPLVETCYHWLHVYSGHIEIRLNAPWALKQGNWWIRWHPSGFYHAVRRFQDPSQTTLLDTGSELVKTITRIFTHFEFPSQILVFASTNGRISVELKRMELSFHINREGFATLVAPRCRHSTKPRCGYLVWPHEQDCRPICCQPSAEEHTNSLGRHPDFEKTVLMCPLTSRWAKAYISNMRSMMSWDELTVHPNLASST